MSPRLLLSLLFVALHALAAAPSFQQVAGFTQPPRNPMARMLYVASDGNYYGTTSVGGALNKGTIFRLTPAGVMTTLVSFTGNSGTAKGEVPDAGLVLGADGAMYGVTLGGGALGYGTMFKVTTNGLFTTLVEFTGTGGLAKGSVPNELVLAVDGSFYGTTQAGGANDHGTLFKYTPLLSLFVSLVDFTGTSGLRKGSAPVGALVANGLTVYGVTQYGGNNDRGTVFKLDLAIINLLFETLVNFTGTGGNYPGSYPAAGLCLHSDGALYGTTEYGGLYDAGVVFRVAAGGGFSNKYEFNDTEGAQPAGALVMGADSALYGTASSGGPSGDGTIFRIPAGGSMAGPAVAILEFTGDAGAARGSSSRAGLAPGPGGVFVGTCSAGGAGNEGTVFTCTISGFFTHLTDFTNATGWTPAGGVAFDATGEMIVPMRHGGVNGNGTLLRVTPGGVVSLEAFFGGALGEEPAGGLSRVGSDFFGFTGDGGTSSRGTFFRHTPGLATTTLMNCTLSTGATPEGPLTLGPDGNFYGVAREGGAWGKGAILRLTPAGGRTTLASFSGIAGAPRGTRPRAPLAMDANGNFYGVTENGGTNDLGTAFMMLPDGTIITLLDFAAAPAPNTPRGGLVAGPDGNFYGTTAAGGESDNGTVFRLTPGGVLTELVTFTGGSGAAPGSEPSGALLAALDGTLYGTTSQAGGNGDGTVFKISPAGVHTTLFAFTGQAGSASGAHASGELAFGPDGFLYGTATEGGAQGGGTVFRLAGLGPHVVTDAPQLAPGVVTLQGRAQTGGDATALGFDYGTTPALGSTVAAIGAPGSPVAFSTTLTGLTSGTTMYFRARAMNANGTSLGAVRTLTVPFSPLDAWKLANFGTTEVADLDDSDTDGDANLTEYGLVTPPTVSDHASRPKPQLVTYPEGRRLALTLKRDPARNDITVEVLAAGAVTGPWTPVATSALGAPFSGPGYVGGDADAPGVKTVEIRDTVNAAAVSSRFLRIQVTH